AKAASDYITANGCAGGDPTDPTDPPPAGDLEASGSRSKGGGQLDLVWSGFSSSNVDITLTSGGATVLQDTQVNDGAVSYSGADKRATYTVTICESGTTTCAASFQL
ncbi:MAG: peptidase S8, partial [Kangiella sp.]|nr:peptidase S8 [Kangiella sp.]